MGTQTDSYEGEKMYWASEETSDKGFCLIKKQDIEGLRLAILPTIWSTLFMRMIFEIKKPGRHRPKGLFEICEPIKLQII